MNLCVIYPLWDGGVIVYYKPLKLVMAQEQEDSIGKYIACSYCGHVNRVHIHFCAKCGKRFAGEDKV